MKNRAVFLDRDGIVNRLIDGRPPWKISELSVYEDIVDICDTIRLKGYKIVIVTNQPDVMRGAAEYKEIVGINSCISDVCGVDLLLTCFHPFDGFCECRKPKPGMLVQAEAMLDIDLQESVMVGDRCVDVKAGSSCGCSTILLANVSFPDIACKPDVIAKDRKSMREEIERFVARVE